MILIAFVFAATWWFIDIILRAAFYILYGIAYAIVWVIKTIAESNRERRINASQSQYSDRR
jgi:Sec-independent protein secretion pathway component TatC